MKSLLVLSAILVITAVRADCYEPSDSLFGPGRFFVGCNYWAGHAGMHMWSRWDEDVVRKELAALSGHGVTVMRVFPLWSDFQPLTRLHGGGNVRAGFQQNGGDMENPAAVSGEMMRRFRVFCDIADENGIKLVVGLVTGWMSGRMYVPPAFDEANVLTDPEAIMWETRFVRHFVQTMKDHPAIAAWDFGNECNCMGPATTAEFYNWMNAIGSAIRLADPTRPVVSGLHGMSTRDDKMAPIRLVGELSDVLTTHPYSFYVPGCAEDPLGTPRPVLHPVAESLLYRDLGGRPCFIEEIGSIGTSCNSEERTAASMRATLFSAWANDLKGFLWWCNSDQEGLRIPPYEWTAYERELGMMRADLSPKPIMREMQSFAKFRKSLPFDRLPARKTDCVIVVPERSDGWICGFGAYLLAVQAGFSPVFAGAEHALPDSSFYVVCSAESPESYTYSAQCRIFDRAKQGDCVLVIYNSQSRFTHLIRETGLAADYGTKSPIERRFSFADLPRVELVCRDSWTCRLKAAGCKVLASTADGEPAFTSFANGKGCVLVCNSPIDREAIARTDVLASPVSMPYWHVLERARRMVGMRGRVEKTACPQVFLTEHPCSDGRTVVIAVNCDSSDVTCPVRMEGCLGTVWRGDVAADRIRLPANEAAVFELR